MGTTDPGTGASHESPETEHEFELAARLAAIIESSSEAIFGKTPGGVITSWNAGAARMFGYTAEEIIGRDAAVLTPPGRRGELARILDRIRRGERVEPFETQRRHRDGTIVDVSLCISPIRDRDGTVTGSSTVARDVTGRNRAEAQRRALEQELHRAERLETLGQLAGGLAHDFNNLLAAVTSYAGFIVEGTADRPRVQADAAQIQAAAQRAAGLIRQLLIFGHREPVLARALNLNSVLDGVRDLLRASVGPHVELRLIPATQPAALLADRGRLEQVLLNLAVNARDAMPDGGTLRIAVRHLDLDGEFTAAHPPLAPGPHVELTVRDTGTGMPPDVAACIFDPFFTTKPAGEGTGLGLSTVYGIVTQAGGTVTVDTRPGAGTTFRLYFPATDQPVAPEPAPTGEQETGAGLARETVLVVDDEPAVLAVTSRILRQHGYRTLEAGSGEEALSLARSRDFQLLLTDSVLPGIAGPTLVERVTSLRPGVPVIRMSGSNEPAPRPGQVLGPEPAFIQKPFSAARLIGQVRASLAAAAPPGAGAAR